jgi:hypothetical protein
MPNLSPAKLLDHYPRLGCTFYSVLYDLGRFPAVEMLSEEHLGFPHVHCLLELSRHLEDVKG